MAEKRGYAHNVAHQAGKSAFEVGYFAAKGKPMAAGISLAAAPVKIVGSLFGFFRD